MPRQKPTSTQRLNDEQRAAQNWAMGEREDEPNAIANLLAVDDDDYNSEEDEDYAPPGIPTPRAPRETKTRVKREKNLTLEEIIETDDALQTLIKGANYLVRVQTIPNIMKQGQTQVTLEGDAHKVAEFTCTLMDDGKEWPELQEFLDNMNSEFYIYVSELECMSFVYFEMGSKVHYQQIKGLMGTKKLEGFKYGKKRMPLILAFDPHNGWNQEERQLTVTVQLLESNLTNLDHPSDVLKILRPVRQTLCCFLGQRQDDGQDLTDSENEDETVARPDIDKLYGSIWQHHVDEGNYQDIAGFNPQHKSLQPILRPYQRHAVNWMTKKENCGMFVTHTLHPLYQEITLEDGSVFYWNRSGGYIIKNKPFAAQPQPGGILADEMGLGKTVEVLALLLCHPRTCVKKPEWIDPITIKKESRKRKRGRLARAPSPTEFYIKEDEPNEVGLEVEAEKRKNVEIIQLDGAETSDSDFDPDTESESDDDKPLRPKQSTSRASKRTRFQPETDSEEEMLVKKWKKAAKRPKTSSGKKKSASKVKTKSNLEETKESKSAKFDPRSILKGETVTKNSSLSSMILDCIINSGEGSSVYYIKTYLSKKFQKENNKAINQAVLTLAKKGMILNFSGVSGASGSYMINPDYATFDSRRLLIGKNLDSVDRAVEDTITKICYEGKNYEKTSAELKVEQKLKQKQSKKQESTYQKLKQKYDEELKEVANIVAYRKQKKWNGTYFETKAEQCEFFECLCGIELDEDEDPKHRIQCSSCRVWQHSECVKFDVEDPYRGEYFCPHCWMESELVESGATLIITPATIVDQWVEEIQRHIKNTNIKMLYYKGTKASGYIQPRTLACYNLVITTYTVLQSETNYLDLPHANSSEGRRFRNPKRFMALPATLPCINWWRVCLDEAQMIENSTSKTAEMALRLKAVNRWCVTGTPIGKSLDDIRGLLLFLQIDPYHLEYWWQTVLCRPYLRGISSPLHKVLSQVMWRTSKKDVLDQINIPKQTEEIHWMSFSAIEEHFYRKLFIDSSQEMAVRLRAFPKEEMRLSEMDRKTLQLLLGPLLRVRQSCCHPQAVRGQFMSLKSNTMTMEDLLEQMIKKITLECEDSNRAYIASLNGLAGIDIIEKKWVDAAEKYREVLRFIEENKSKLKTDTLQRLHTIVNLTELIDAKHEGIHPTIRDGSLREEAESLRQQYLKKYSTAIEASSGALQPAIEAVEACRENFKCETSNHAKEDKGAWYVQVINKANSTCKEENLLTLIQEEMSQFYDVVNNREFDQIKARYSNSRTIMCKIFEKIEELDNLRKRVTKELTRIQNKPAEFFLNDSVDCHLRQSNVIMSAKKKCDLCCLNDDLALYEACLFHFIKGEIKTFAGANRKGLAASECQKLEEAGVYLLEEQKKGTWADSEVERLLRGILKYSKQKDSQLSKEVTDDGATHMKLFESLKKEFRLIRIHWRQLYDQVAAVDELNMSVMRLRVRYEDEPLTNLGAMRLKKSAHNSKHNNLATKEKNKLETIYILEQFEIPSQIVKLVSDKTVALNEYRRKYGQLFYLENLRKSDYGKDGTGENPELCPICQRSLGTQWSVLQCGHSYCIECIKRLLEEFSTGGPRSGVKCAVCRDITYHREVSYVDTKKHNETENDIKASEAVKGSLSTKIEAVVKTLIRIQMVDPGAKSLVFSTWTEVLNILAFALTENNISYASFYHDHFKRNLEKFKNRDDVKVLLMPVASGANGLNLVSASHVLLVEPILNPAQELQAIGRVHRIGQTKPTVVHRFLIKSTIEERMYNMLRSYKFEESQQGSHITEENVITVKDLRGLFD